MSTRTLKTIRINPLDTRSIRQAIREVQTFKRQLDEAMTDLIRLLLESGADMARIEVSAFNAIDTGALQASIGHGAYDPASRTGVIYAGAYYAFFVEYGTGIVGAASPHPEPETASQGTVSPLFAKYDGYDSQGHGEAGWFYRSDVDGKRHWTQGMVSRPFMYNTMMYLRDYVEREGGKTIATYIGGGAKA